MIRATLFQEISSFILGSSIISLVEYVVLRKASRNVRMGVLTLQLIGFATTYKFLGRYVKRDKRREKLSSADGRKQRSSSFMDATLKPTPNPFVNKTWILSPLQRLKLAFNAVTLFPVRVVVLLASSLGVCALSAIVVGGAKDTERKPLSGTRVAIRDFFMKPLVYSILWSFGVWRVKFKGKCAPTSEAPVLCGVPHICFLEPFALMGLHAAMGVSRAENAKYPLFGFAVMATQMILVDRKDPKARQKVAQTIIDRANSNVWNRTGPIGIFPEGTTHSQSCLLHFKSGAFRTKTPVQLVLIRMPWKYEDPSWGSGGPSLPSLMFRSMCQFVVHLEFEYLPVIKPTEEQKSDPVAYATFCQKRCAVALNVPRTKHSISDVFLANEARKLCHDPNSTKELVEAVSQVPLSHFGKIYDMDIALAKAYLQRFAKMDSNSDGHLTYEEFKRGFEIESDAVATGLFTLMDTNESGKIDFKEFLVGVAILNGRKKGKDSGTGFDNAVAFAFDVFDSDQNGLLCLEKLTKLMRKAFPGLSSKQISQQQIGIKTNEKGQVSKTEFVRFCRRLHDHKDAFRDAHFGSIYIAPTTTTTTSTTSSSPPSHSTNSKNKKEN